GSGFDQIWQKPNGTFCVVEAKGPGAKLGSSAAKGEQMSTEWVLKTAQGMAKNKDNKKKTIGGKIVQAIESEAPKVEGYVIKSTPTEMQAKKGWQDPHAKYN
ncbi:MAG: hypothetical protein ACI8ZM_004798, partial [Crocinitomix sp.]